LKGGNRKERTVGKGSLTAMEGKLTEGARGRRQRGGGYAKTSLQRDCEGESEVRSVSSMIKGEKKGQERRWAVSQRRRGTEKSGVTTEVLSKGIKEERESEKIERREMGGIK